MAIFNIFSKRQQALRGEVSDVYTYDNFSNKLRVQLHHLIVDGFGVADYYGEIQMENDFENIHQALVREYGVFFLVSNGLGFKNNVLRYFLDVKNYEHCIDVVELCLIYIDKIIRTRGGYFKNIKYEIGADDIISEVNERFKENGVGYVYESGRIIRIDSQIMHKEVAKPTLSLLNNPKFVGANEEYLQAHKHYMEGKNKECLNDCLKAFESTLKIICKEKGWPFDEKKDTAKKLISICLENELVPEYMQTQINSLRGALESGVPVIRNKNSGHGQGQVPQKVDDSLTRYTLNLTGTNIIFLIEQSGVK